MNSSSAHDEGGLRMTQLAQAFSEIEASSSRRHVTLLLARLFTLGPQDATTLPCLLQGRLGPPFAAPNLGIDEHGIVHAIAQVTGRPADEVRRRYQQQGDLGIVAEQLLAARSASPSHSTNMTGDGPAGDALSVRQVYDRLLGIATASGKGARERKVAALHELLLLLQGVEARYVVRIVQAKLRLQIGDATIMDALSIAVVGSTALRDHIARSYSLCADLGLVASTLLSSGAAALEQIHPTPGRPVLFALAERLPSAQAIVQRLGPVLAEPKYDGLRLQAQKDGDQVWLFTRRLENVTASFPDIVQAVQRQVRVERAILDGEAIGYDPQAGQLLPFQETMRRRRTHGVERLAGTVPLRYYVFDLLALDGMDCTTWPQRERSRHLRMIIQSEPDQPSRAERLIHVTPQLVTDDAAELERFFAAEIQENLEGIMAKRPDAPYQAGARTFNWVKLKPEYQTGLRDTFDLVIVGYNRGRGRRAALGIGSLLCAVYDPTHDRLRTVTRVGSGLRDEAWRHLREQLDAARLPEKPRQVEATIAPDVWVEPRIVVEVLAGGITRSPEHTAGKSGVEPGYALRFPRILRIRDDRRPEDATSEAELIALAQQAAHTGQEA